MNPFDVSGWKSSKNGYSPGFSGLITTEDFAPGPSTFSTLRGRLSNSIGVVPSLAISILMRLPAGTSRPLGVNTPSRATSANFATSSASAVDAMPSIATITISRSIPTFFSRAGVGEIVFQREWREPRADAGFLVDVTAERRMRAAARRRDAHRELVAAGARELDVIAVVRAVVGHHRHHHALDHVLSALLRHRVMHVQIRDPRAVGEAVGVLVAGMDVGFEMDVGELRVAHHPRRLHHDGLQVNGGELHAGTNLRLADRILERERHALGDQHRRADQGEPREENYKSMIHIILPAYAGGFFRRPR